MYMGFAGGLSAWSMMAASVTDVDCRSSTYIAGFCPILHSIDERGRRGAEDASAAGLYDQTYQGASSIMGCTAPSQQSPLGVEKCIS